MAEYLKLPASEFADNTPRVIKTTEENGVHVIHVNVESLPVEGATNVPDGADATQGSIADPGITQDEPGTVSGKLRGLVRIFSSVWDAVNGRLRVDGSQVTQPVSADSLPLPDGAATEQTLTDLNSKLRADESGLQVSVQRLPQSTENLLQSIAQPTWKDPSTGRLNVNNITSIDTLSAVTTVNTLTSLSQIAGFDARQTLLFAAERANWGQNIRNRIS